VSYLWAAPAMAAGVYYLIALVAALARLRLREPDPRATLPVSILKPVRGRDPRFYEAIRSHATLDYPDFQILFGVRDPADPAIADIRRLQAEFPRRDIQFVLTTRDAPNGKVAVLAELAALARHPILLVNDSDILVESDYLRRVVASLEDPRTGMVTCLYRARAESWPGRWEAIGISTEFAPSVLVAPLAGIDGFALGSTMVFRASQLAQIGGFASLESYLADDYQLGARIARLGYRVVLSKVVVETNLSGARWAEVWRHQLRWSRTIRVSRTAGYYGYLATQAAFWSLVAAMAGHFWIAAAALCARLVSGLVVGRCVLEDRQVAKYWYLMPFRDLWGFAVWVAGLSGDTVVWRGQQLRLAADGKIR
jgi:hopanoid biosynthesis associated glycosyl transferase protein HpnI